MICNAKGLAGIGILAALLASAPAMADGLVGSVTGAVSNTVGSVTGAVGGVTSAVGGTVNGVTGGSPTGGGLLGGGGGILGGSGGGLLGGGLQTNGQVQLFGSQGVANLQTRSQLLNGITADLRLLNKKELVTICANVGGGTGCGSGSTTKLLNLISSRIRLLSNTSLASLCLSIGGSCGGGGAGGGNGGGGGSGNGGGGITRVSSGNSAAMKKTCRSVLAMPDDYDAQLTRLCRMVGRL